MKSKLILRGTAKRSKSVHLAPSPEAKLGGKLGKNLVFAVPPILILLFLVTNLAALACTSSAPSGASPVATQVQSTATAPSEDSRTSAKDKEWEKVLKAAKQEGTLSWLNAVGPEVLQPVSRAFSEKFGIKVESTILLGAEMVAKLKREHQAGIYAADIITGGSTTLTMSLQPQGLLDPIEPYLILPEVTDPKVWWQGKLPIYGYGTGVAIVKSPRAKLLINTKFVKPEEIKSYWDLLNPRFKGKILTDDPIGAGAGLNLNASILRHMPRGEEFLRELVKQQQPVLVRDRRLLTEWVVREKFWITIAPRVEVTQTFLEMGAPLAFVTPVEGNDATAGGGIVSVVNRAPHPNAARIFTNWILTKEGTTTWSRYHLYQSSRIDAPTDFLPSFAVREPGVQYFDSNVEDWEIWRTKQQDILRDIYAPILQ